MRSDPNTFEELVAKFQRGTIRADELQQLKEWYVQQSDDYVELELAPGDSREQIKARMLQGLLERVRSDKSRDTTRRLRPFIQWAAAAILVAASLTWVLWSELADRGDTLAGPLASTVTEIHPGGNRATLILEGGQQLALSSDQEGIVVGQDIRYQDGTDISVREGLDLSTGNRLVLQTPRGGTYQVTLSDGTKVWLNAASSISYPSRFSDQERVVSVKGEAYFEVRAARRGDGTLIPFRVLSKGQEIHVLGTQFNLSAYPDQADTRTTLVEGKIVLHAGSKPHAMRVGTQATLSPGGDLTVRSVQTDAYTAWKEGRFAFDGKSFAEIMTEIGHWYDLQIVYEGQVPDAELVGDAFRSQQIASVLRMLDVAEINYSIDVQNRKLIIR